MAMDQRRSRANSQSLMQGVKRLESFPSYLLQRGSQSDSYFFY